jgi:hypothetical protein
MSFVFVLQRSNGLFPVAAAGVLAEHLPQSSVFLKPVPPNQQQQRGSHFDQKDSLDERV